MRMLYGTKKEKEKDKTPKMTIDDISLVLSRAQYPDLLHFANVFKETLAESGNIRLQDISVHDWAHAFYVFATEYHNSEERKETPAKGNGEAIADYARPIYPGSTS